MSASWIQNLNPTLQQALRDGSWQRIERTRDGRWLALPLGGGADTSDDESLVASES